jgi:hypothetical protein
MLLYWAAADKMFKLPDFMAPSNKKPHDHRPRPLQSSKSWSRIEPESPSRPGRNKNASTTQKSTTQNGAGPELDKKEHADQTSTFQESNMSKVEPDVFEKGTDEDGRHEAVEGVSRMSVDCDDLPIELISLTDRYVQSARDRTLLTCMQLYRIPLRQGASYTS